VEYFFGLEIQNIRYEIDGCTFTANHVNNSSGGGLEHFFPGYTPVEKIELIVKKSRFFLNKSGGGGGIASYILSDLGLYNLLIDECLFESNYSQNGGAGILRNGVKITFQFQANYFGVSQLSFEANSGVICRCTDKFAHSIAGCEWPLRLGRQH